MRLEQEQEVEKKRPELIDVSVAAFDGTLTVESEAAVGMENKIEIEIKGKLGPELGAERRAGEYVQSGIGLRSDSATIIK
ncbi:hypothetical protein EVAR_80165_1 [Eumeta japonica]|uniref:Uncharacterized protein n=1 Tax=Eumeta variegata TaxID=151549 RepID=A0A4C1YA90_EUMVA|nr:hypothetical protein EVAR_80165_1 [Eumeta japonica]